MNVERIQFMAQPAKTRLGEESDECAGCLFARQRMEVCRRACELAKLRGLPDCEDRSENNSTYIYVRTAVDPRQIDLLAEVEA